MSPKKGSVQKEISSNRYFSGYMLVFGEVSQMLNPFEWQFHTSLFHIRQIDDMVGLILTFPTRWAQKPVVSRGEITPVTHL